MRRYINKFPRQQDVDARRAFTEGSSKTPLHENLKITMQEAADYNKTSRDGSGAPFPGHHHSLVLSIHQALVPIILHSLLQVLMGRAL